MWCIRAEISWVIGDYNPPPRAAAKIAPAVKVYARRRNAHRTPPLYAFLDDLALPTGVFGPVALLHGCHFLINADCRVRRSEPPLWRMQYFDLR